MRGNRAGTKALHSVVVDEALIANGFHRTVDDGLIVVRHLHVSQNDGELVSRELTKLERLRGILKLGDAKAFFAAGFNRILYCLASSVGTAVVSSTSTSSPTTAAS